MSKNFVERFCHKYFQKNPRKSKEDVIKNLTHLYLNGQKLEEIGEISCEQLKVLYLHNNYIQRLNPNLDQLTHLTHLYLQWNRIRQFENLNRLTNLRKLYLSYNEISHLDGIDNLNFLTELHLEYQRLQPNTEFTFDVNSLIGISTSLRVLNLSGLYLTELTILKTLPHLTKLVAADNNFESSDYIASSINCLNGLQVAVFAGCPAHKNDIHYRNKIILESKSLVMLDNKEINEVTRTFLKNFDRVKSELKQKVTNSNSSCIKGVDIDLREDPPLAHPEGIVFDVTTIISQAIIENVPST